MNNKKRITAMLVTLALLFTFFPADREILADELIKMKFDLGGKGTAPGYIGVSASDKYDPQTGYGFNDTNLTENVDAPGKGALGDAVHFEGSNGHLKVDLPKGVYKIRVTTGSVDSTTITAEGIAQLYFLKGSNKTDSFTIPVTDGQLNISAGHGVGTVFSLSTIEIEQESDGTLTKPTIWIGGDETSAVNYDASDKRRTWGEYLANYVNTDKYDIRNISANGVSAEEHKKSLFPTIEHYGKSGDILLISLGINDYSREYGKHPDAIDPSGFVSNLTDMVRRAKAKGMKVFLVDQIGVEGDTSMYPLPEYKWFGREIEDTAKKEGAGFIDLFRPWLEFSLDNRFFDEKEYYVSGIGVNAEGADILARTVASRLWPSKVPVSPTPALPGTPTVIYETAVAGGPISNPHKGFVMTSYAPHNIDSSLGYEYGIGGAMDNRAWDVVTIVSGSPHWDDLNPAEGVYNFDEIDKMLDKCEEYGLTYGIRIMPFSSYLEEDFVPQWVYDKGAAKNTAVSSDDPSRNVVFPKWDDPVYIKAHKDFVTALGARYDGDPRVEFVDIRPFGDFGEWHNSFAVGDYMPSVEIQKDMLDHYAACFKKTLIVLPSDARGEVYKYALSIGIAKRDDGLIMTPNREWSLVPAYRANLPVLGENYWPYAWMRDLVRENEYSYVNWTPEHFRETIEISHLSIFALDQDSHSSYEFYKEQKDVIDEMCNRLGYNFTVTSAVLCGNRLVIRVRNTGLAPAFFDIDLCAELTDAEGNRNGSFGSPVRIGKGTFRDGEERTFEFEYEGVIPSDATICLAMYDIGNPLAAGKDPTVRFDNKNNLLNKRLKLVETWRSEDEPAVTPAPQVTVTAVPSGTPATVTSKVTPNVTSSVTPGVTGKVTPAPSTMPSPKPRKEISDFVERLYKYVLNRAPEEGGLGFWTDELYSFRRTGAEVAQGFIFSLEFEGRGTSDEEFVKILYRTFFGREAEEEGLKFWTDSLRNGTMDRVNVANGFIFSKEWADTCARYGIRSGGTTKPSVAIEPGEATFAFVERMYSTALGRKSDPEGLKYWAGELADFNVTGEFVGVFFFESDEMKGLGLSDEEFVTRLYKTFMDREPEQGGFGFWVGLLGDGGTREEVIRGFTRSEEFTDKCIRARILPY